MAVYFAVGLPTDDGRIQDFRLVPPPGGDMVNPVLVWNKDSQEPVWMDIAELVSGVPTYSNNGPLVTDNGEWLITDTGARLVASLN